MTNVAMAIEKPISAALTPASLTNVVPFRQRSGRLPKREITTFNGGQAPQQTTVPVSVASANRGTSVWPGVPASEFARSDRGGGTISKGSELTADDEIHLTLLDLLVTAFLFISAATGPALVWLILRTAS